MKLTPWYLVAFAPIAVAGCSGAFLGHFAVLGVTLCIFFGTLTLGRQRTGSTSARTGPIGSAAAVEVPSAASAVDASKPAWPTEPSS